MMRLTTHIERLLLTNDCVIVPGFGGFVSRTIPEAKEEEAHRFRPVRKEIVFNGTLRHTDGLLPESYMRMYGVDYQEARLMMDEDIESLRATLEREKRITLGRIGAFSVGEEGQVIFSPGDSVVLTGDVPFPRFAPLIGRGNARHRGTNHGEESEKRCILHSDQSQMGAGNSRLSGRCRLVSPDIDSYKRRQPIRLYGQFHPYRDDSFPFRGPAPTNRGNARASHRDTEWHGRGQARQEGGNRQDGIVGSRP